jgi:hypothetical protein
MREEVRQSLSGVGGCSGVHTQLTCILCRGQRVGQGPPIVLARDRGPSQPHVDLTPMAGRAADRPHAEP